MMQEALTFQCGLTVALNVLVFSCFFFNSCFAVHSGIDDSESCENGNGAASALLHIDESDGVDEINRQRNKNKRRSEHRQVQTGKGISENSQVHRCWCHT